MRRHNHDEKKGTIGGKHGITTLGAWNLIIRNFFQNFILAQSTYCTQVQTHGYAGSVQGNFGTAYMHPEKRHKAGFGLLQLQAG